MVTQDPRVIPSALEDVDDFFTSLARNNNDHVARFIELEPSLLYARNDNGGTALHVLIIRNDPVELETLKVLLEAAAAAGVVPDLTLVDNAGFDVMRILGAIEDSPLHGEFWAALNPYMLAYNEAVEATARADTSAYFDRDKTRAGREAAREVEDGDKKCIIMRFEEAENTGLSRALYNMGQEKEFNRFNAEITQQLEALNFDFRPKAYLPNMVSSDEFSVVMLPSILEEFSLEQIVGIVKQVSDYLLDYTAD